MVFFRILKRTLWGIARHFLLHTIITYGLHIDLPAIRARKEGLVLAGTLALLPHYRTTRKIIYQHRRSKRLTRLLLLLIIRSGITTILIHQQGLYQRILSIKYNLLPIAIVLIIYTRTTLLSPKHTDTITKTLLTITKTLLVIGILRRFGIQQLPTIFETIGYSTTAYQRIADQAPPLYYLTNVRWGYVRNQAIFGGPTSRGFFLIALGPWFIAHITNKQQNTPRAILGRTILYTTNIILTFSRAARGIALLQAAIISAYLLTRKHYKPRSQNNKRSRIVGLSMGILGTILLITSMGPHPVPQAQDRPQGLIQRDLSDSGHIKHLQAGIILLRQQPRRGYGGASVGPATFHDTQTPSYAPENNYLQIALEYGLPSLILRLFARVIIAYQLRNKQKLMLLLGLTGLAGTALVLHPFADSQTSYVMAIIIGTTLATKKHKQPA